MTTLRGIAQLSDWLLTHMLLAYWRKLLIGLFGVQAVYWFFTHPVNNFWVEGENLERFGSGFFAFGSNRSRLGNETHPTDWTRLRDRWEYSHLGRAGLALVSLISLVIAISVNGETRIEGAF